ncbi:MAG TPA: hypothetical protein VHY79_00690 [Rhizomicrobium sp.]|nr:hypothetical protein [Rhizomicrobium sp.]
MNLRTTAIAVGVTAALCTCAAFAQPAAQSGAYNQGQGSYQQGPNQQPYHKHHHGHGIVALLREEMSAGRLSQKEGMLLMQKIKQMHAEKRAEREARQGGERASPQMQPQR